MNWLFVTTSFPWPPTHGTWLRVYHLARTLRAQGDQVSVLTPRGGPEMAENYSAAGVTVLEAPSNGPGRRGRSRCTLAPYIYDPALAEHLANQAPGYDAVVLMRPDALQYSPEAMSARYLIAEMVDDPILEAKRRPLQQIGPAAWARRARFFIGEYWYEKVFLKPVSLTTFVSDNDAGSFTRRHRRQPVATVPNGVDVQYFSRPATARGNGSHPTVAFLGNMTHLPNAHAAEVLIREVAPLICKEIPETRFVIAGCNPPQDLHNLAGPNVEITGMVDDVRPTLWQATVVMLPMRMGTGIKNKLLEAWASGAAVVATPLACQGTHARDGENLLLAESPHQLAHSTVRLIRDETLRRELSAQGRKTVEQYLTWGRTAEKLRKEVSQLGFN